MPIVYCDGSSTNGFRANYQIAYGLLVLEDDSISEQFGMKTVDRRFHAHHEEFAIIESILFLVNRGYKPEQCSIYTDDETAGYAAFHLHSENYSSRREDILLRYKSFIDKYFDPAMYEVVIHWLKNVRMTKLKGHAFTVYNNRVDYLSNRTLTSRKIHDFESWVMMGFCRFLNNTKSAQHFYHFTNSI